MLTEAELDVPQPDFSAVATLNRFIRAEDRRKRSERILRRTRMLTPQSLIAERAWGRATRDYLAELRRLERVQPETMLDCVGLLMIVSLNIERQPAPPEGEPDHRPIQMGALVDAVVGFLWALDQAEAASEARSADAAD